MITNHRYDSGPQNTHGPCIADTNPENWPYAACGQPEAEHAHSEYPDTGTDEAPASAQNRSERATRAPGDMHEPRPYPASHLHFE